MEDFGYYWIVWDENTTQSHFTEDNYDYVGYNFQFGPLGSGPDSGFIYYPFIDTWES